MRCTRLLMASVLAFPLFGQLQNRPPVLQLSLKQAVEIAVAPEGSTRVRLARGSFETSPDSRRSGARGAFARRVGLPAVPEPDQHSESFWVQVSRREYSRLQLQHSDLPRPVRHFRCPVQREPERFRFQFAAAIPGVQSGHRSGEGRQRWHARPGDRSGGARVSGLPARRGVAPDRASQRRAFPGPAAAGEFAEGRGHRHRDRDHAGPGAAGQRPAATAGRREPSGSIASAVVEGDRASARQSGGVDRQDWSTFPWTRSTPSRRWRTRAIIAPS